MSDSVPNSHENENILHTYLCDTWNAILISQLIILYKISLMYARTIYPIPGCLNI